MNISVDTPRKVVWHGRDPFGLSFSFLSLSFEMAAYAMLIRHIHAYGEQFSSGLLWPHRVRYAFDSFNNYLTES